MKFGTELCQNWRIEGEGYGYTEDRIESLGLPKNS